MKVINRQTGQVLNTTNRTILLHSVLSTVYNQFMLESETLNKVVRKYRNAPLVPYEMTDRDKEKLAENPDYINDIPRYYVEGYDKEVSGSRFDQKIWDEFVRRFNANDQKIADFINRVHPVYKAVMPTEIKVAS